jgi:hypothetical protein
MDASDAAHLRQKHAEFLRLEAVARSRAAGMSSPDEKKAWETLAQSWRCLAAEAEALVGQRRFANTSQSA